MKLSRRAMVLGSLALPAVSRAEGNPIAALERKSGGRLGVSILNTGTGARLDHRQDERFAMCSTFKLLAVSLLLTRVDKGQDDLDRRVHFTKENLISYSPVTEKFTADGMTLAELCGAALTMSDNTAANLILASIGGPPAVTAYARSIGDNLTRLDRNEPSLNEAAPNDPRDTTTPSAMLNNLHATVLGNVLSPDSRLRLVAWLVACQTGAKRLRAGFPPDWKAGDKTGSGNNGVANDIAVIWPPGRAPLIVTAYFAESQIGDDQRDSVLAEVGRIAAGV
jgi:beta-lactamase class A